MTKPSSGIHIKFAVGYRDESGKLIVSEGAAAEARKRAEMLFLHYDLQNDGYVYLLGVNSMNDIELLSPEKAGQPSLQVAGEHDFPNKNDIRGVSLKGVKGKYAVIGLASSKPLDYQKQIMPMIRDYLDMKTGSFHINSNNGTGGKISSDIVYLDLSGNAS